MPHHLPLIATIVSGLVLALVFGAQAQIGAALPIVARGHHEEEIEHLNKQGATMAIVGEHELARGMLARTVGAAPGAPPPDASPA